MSVIGLDIGTTGTKAIAFDDDGRAVASAYRGYPLLTSHPGWLELDPATVLSAVDDVILETATKAREQGGGDVVALAAATLGEAVVPVDTGMRPLDNSITPLDTRAVAQVAAFADEVMDAADFFEITGQMPHPVLTLAKVTWWRDERPEVFARAHRFLCWNEMLAVRLGLRPAIAPSLAARTGFYDIRRRDWSDTILNRMGVDRSRLGDVVEAGDIVGTIPADLCEALGLARGCRLVSGGWDQACAALGAGALDPGLVVNSMGSTDSLNATYAGANTSAAIRMAALTCNPHAAPELFCTNAFSTSGGNLVRWWREQFAGLEEEVARRDARDVYDVIVDRAMEATQPVLVPAHFAGTGTPHMDPDARGAFVGMTLGTTRADVARGIFEGIAFEMALNLELLRHAGIPVHRVLAGGGAARNPKLLQLRADIYRTPVTALRHHESGVMGCALLARAALDDAPSLRDLADGWVGLGDTYEPEATTFEPYGARYDAYIRLYEALRASSVPLSPRSHETTARGS